MKTSELQGAALDWAVAKCEGFKPVVGKNPYGIGVILSHYEGPYSQDWQYGGPIIEREKIHVVWSPKTLEWGAAYPRFAPMFYVGLTPLIAAMRCYCRAKLGDEVEIPEELNGTT